MRTHSEAPEHMRCPYGSDYVARAQPVAAGASAAEVYLDGTNRVKPGRPVAAETTIYVRRHFWKPPEALWNTLGILRVVT